MSKDPAFLFYPNDYLGGTMGFSFEQQGAYLTLLIYQFNNEYFSEEKAIEIISDNLWKKIRSKFISEDGKFYNKRLKNEIEKRKNYSESRRKNVESRYKSKRKSNLHMKNICSTYGKVEHMENENENEIVNINNIEIPSEFIEFYNLYPGTKSKKKDWENFKKKFKTEIKSIIPLLKPNLEKEITYKAKLKELGQFCPEWKILTTWINNRCWEQEFPDVNQEKKFVELKPYDF